MVQILPETTLPDFNDLLACKAYLKEETKKLSQLFHQQNPAEAPIETLVKLRAKTIDAVLAGIWQHFFQPPVNGCLVAVGGYGRGELHPASDIDILLLFALESDIPKDQTEQLITFLWDLGLDIGHSVRTLAECVQEAEQDLTVITNLLESRLLEGDQKLFQDLKEAIKKTNFWPSEDFFAAKLEEQQQRHLKYGETAYKLEPNIKESPGGLRDIQAICWVAKRHFGIDSLEELEQLDFIAKSELDKLIQGQQLLWRIRFALHDLTGRHEDRLLFDYQGKLAELFGHQGKQANESIESFMQDYYRAIQSLNRLNEMLLQYFQEAILPAQQTIEITPISKRFQHRNGYLEVCQDQVFQQTPLALLEIFLVFAENPSLKGIRASTIRLIRNHLHLIDEDFRQDISSKSLFMEILKQPQGITKVLRRMHLYGVLPAYIPAFANIVGRMQYDLFHIFTVDEHTLYLIRNLRRFVFPPKNNEFVLCSDVAQKIPKLELLYLAGLFHDIAKGRKGDHSKLGAVDAREFCQLHQLSQYDTALVSWLVEKHLVMSMTAQRKDINDPEVINEFAEQVMDTTHLDYLFLLTVADSNATNPDRWTQWRFQLLCDLYRLTRATLMRGLNNPVATSELLQRKKAHSLDELNTYWQFNPEQINVLWDKLQDDYFVSNHPEQIAWQTASALCAKPEQLPLVVMQEDTERGFTEIFTYARKHQGIFAQITALMEQLGLSVLDAKIQSTTDGFTFNSFLVIDENGEPILHPLRRNEVVSSLREGIKTPEPIQVTRRTPRQLKHFNVRTSILWSEDQSQQRSILRIITADRPGLLAKIGQSLELCQVRIINAKIATVGEVAEDVFFISGGLENCFISEEQKNCLDDSLKEALQ